MEVDTGVFYTPFKSGVAEYEAEISYEYPIRTFVLDEDSYVPLEEIAPIDIRITRIVLDNLQDNSRLYIHHSNVPEYLMDKWRALIVLDIRNVCKGRFQTAFVRRQAS